MTNRRTVLNLGLSAYGTAAIALGLIGLVWADFATQWQRVGPGVPHRTALALLVGALEFLAGWSLFWRRTARTGTLILTLLFAGFTLLWVRQGLRMPRAYDNWGNVFEELSLTIGGAVAFLSLGAEEGPGPRTAMVARLYAICATSFGVVHFVYVGACAAVVPKSLPFGQVFWAHATGICFFAAALAILSGFLDRLAARLLTLMIFLFEVLVWVPQLAAHPHSHFVWAANGISLMMIGAAWVVADALANQRAAD